LSEVKDVSGKEGDFTVTVTQNPRYVDVDKCIACGLCATKCPKKVDDGYNAGLNKRKAIYVKYAQAVPLKYCIDADTCIYLQKGKCGACEKFCPSQAINFKDTVKEIIVHVGSIVMSPGFTSFDPSTIDIYNYSNMKNVVTSLEFERILAATGPYEGHLVRPSDKKEPRKIGWLQCVGSRCTSPDSHPYCSSVCCMYAVKQTSLAMQHAVGDLDCAVFYMDMRTHGKDFDKYYEQIRSQGTRFVRARIHTLDPVPGTDDIKVRYILEDGSIKDEIFDLFVLSTGLVVNAETVGLAATLGVDLGENNFIKTDSFHPVSTSVPGIYACGVFTGPKDIPQSVMEASAAACAASNSLAPARNSRTTTVPIPAERDISSEPVKVGVFVCSCGINIAGVIDVKDVAEYATTLPDVTYVENNLFTCSQDAQDKMAAVIKEQGLNRVVVASCSPKTHEALFQDTLVNAGLNKYLFEMANIRNHDSWVHADNPKAATEKAKDLVRMAVAKVRLTTPLTQGNLPMDRSALVIGGGIAGMTTALSLSHQGYGVHLVEQSDLLGGIARRLHRTADGKDVETYVNELVENVRDDNGITLHLGTRLANVDGFVGNYVSNLEKGGQVTTVKHGVAVLATGAKEYKPHEYLYGEHPGVLTHLELDERFKANDPSLESLKNVVFIQCVGSRCADRPYCSKVCCTHTMESALELKRKNPKVNIYVMYRDIRTYGEREHLYQDARAAGVMFFRYTPESKPQVIEKDGTLSVEFNDTLINMRLSVDPDMVCLATAIVSNRDETLAQLFKVPFDNDGWFQEAHQKLRPVDFASEGLFVCGMAHYPKPIDESIAQSLAAASRAVTILSKDHITVGGIVSSIDADRCTGCWACVDACPYGAIAVDYDTHVASVNPALCKGCGVCAATCPSEAPIVMGFTPKQFYAQIHNAISVRL